METSIRNLTATCCALILLTRTAGAFEYPEHRSVSNAALARACPTADSPAVLCRAQRALTAALTAADPVNVPDFGDLVAMSGDHSVSPPSLLFRFYSMRPSHGGPNADLLRHQAENLRQDTINRATFLRATHQQAFQLTEVTDDATEDAWLKCRDGKKDLFDGILDGLPILGVKPGTAILDREYVANASANETHFRAPAVDINNDPSVLWSRYYYCLRDHGFEFRACPKGDRSKPELNATSMYGDLHTGALILARAAMLETDHPETRLAASLLLEAFALHFLQDSVSAGHIAVRRYSSATDRGDYHTRTCREGLRVSVPPEAREKLGLQSDTTTLFGDGALWCRGGKNRNARGLTARYADLVTRTSLDEWERAASDVALSHPDVALVVDTNKPCKSSGLLPSVRGIYDNVCQWWEVSPIDQGGLREWVVEHVYRDLHYLHAANQVPMPLPPQPTPPRAH